MKIKIIKLFLITFIINFAIDNGYSPAYQLLNQPITVILANGEKWTPSNFDGTFGGKVTLREALSYSPALSKDCASRKRFNSPWLWATSRCHICNNMCWISKTCNPLLPSKDNRHLHQKIPARKTMRCANTSREFLPSYSSALFECRVRGVAFDVISSSDVWISLCFTGRYFLMKMSVFFWGH